MSLPDRSDRIDRTVPRLLSDQVAEDLRQEIRAKKLTGKLPSELDMAEAYGVSRITVRRALAALIDEGLVTVLTGRGTFVR